MNDEPDPALAFDLAFETAAARGLRRYVWLVAQELGLRGSPYYLQLDTPLSAYVALDRRIRELPTSDLALTWDEREGWTLAVESVCGDDLLPLAYLRADLLPAPHVVAAFARRPLAGPEELLPRPRGGTSGILDRLAAYALPPVDGEPGR
ncbi:DUF6292 family protein [Prauserella oleivorans]|uniref:DUF6292 family protein n=1 Tax=Prauserella oleivorans TaxID=1478153 RepID=A0ABW5W8X6_9PSEU